MYIDDALFAGGGGTGYTLHVPFPSSRLRSCFCATTYSKQVRPSAPLGGPTNPSIPSVRVHKLRPRVRKDQTLDQFLCLIKNFAPQNQRERTHHPASRAQSAASRPSLERLHL